MPKLDMHDIVAGRQRDHRVRAAVLLGDAEHAERVGLGREDAPDEAVVICGLSRPRTGPRARAKPGWPRRWPRHARRRPYACARARRHHGGGRHRGRNDGRGAGAAARSRSSAQARAATIGLRERQSKLGRGRIRATALSPKPGPPTPGPRAFCPPRSATPSRSWGPVFYANRGKFKPEVPHVPETGGIFAVRCLSAVC